MHSYTETNILLRKEYLLAKQKGIKIASKYPENINIKDFCYFLMVPSLVYWYEFPKIEKFRIGYFLRIIA